MSVLKKYLVFEFIFRFISILLVLVFLFIGIEVLSKVWGIKSDFWTFARFYTYKSWGILSQMIPVAVLFSTLSLLSYLAKNNELVALYSSGYSLYKIISPITLIVIFICILNFFLNEQFVPKMNYKANMYWDSKVMMKKIELNNEKKTWFRNKNFIFNVKAYDASAKKLISVNIYYQDEKLNILRHIYAPLIIFKNSKWYIPKFKDTSWGKNKEVSTKISSNFYIDLGIDSSDLNKFKSNFQHLSIGQLRSRIKELKSIGIDPYKYEVKIHERYSISLAAFIMFLLAVPFSVKSNRQGSFALNLSFSFILVLIFWISYSFLINYGAAGHIPPLLAAWSTNAFFLILAIFSFIMLKK